MTAPASAIFVTPSSSGQLSNKRGANTGADALPFSVIYKNPRSTGDQAGTMRISATKISSSGTISSVLDSWWMGAGTASALPSNLDVGPNGRFLYDPGTGPRAYIANSSSVGSPYTAPQIFSASITGPTVGKWRAETALPQYALVNGVGSIAQANGYIYASQVGIGGQEGKLYYAKINSDGTLTGWKAMPGFDYTAGSAGEMSSYSDSTGAYLFGFNASGALGTTCWSAQVNADGTLSHAASGPVMPANRLSCHIYIKKSQTNDGTATIYLIGGVLSSGATSRDTIAWIPVTKGYVFGAWTTTGAGILPGARASGALCVLPGSTNDNTWLYLLGGNTFGVKGQTTGTTTIYRTQVSNILSAWTTDATALPATQCDGGGFGVGVPGATAGQSQLFTFGAGTVNGGTANTLIVRVTNATGVVASVTGTFGIGTALVSGDLGTGGSVVANVDGTQTMVYNWGAIAAIGGAALVDGDIVTVSVQFTDNQEGDVSPTSLISFKVGQPPTITAVAPTGATTNRQPTVSFSYTAGAGGGPEYKYQIQIKDNGGNIVADTGLIAGNANVYAPRLYPMLANALLTSTVITVYSTDTPMPGSSASATATTTFTPTQAAPSNPGTVSITVDNVGASLRANWTNPVGGVTPTFNRLWWRLTGSSTWLPAKDLIVPAAQGSVNQVVLMDTIPMGVSVELGVSSLVGATPGTGESSIVSLGSATISPDYHQDLGGFTAMIHILGNGVAQRVPLPNRPPISFDKHIDAESSMMFGNSAPSVRYSPYSYREISLDVVPLDSQIPTLDAVLAAAQNGNVLVYRDTIGTLIYCGLAPERGRKKDLYYADTIKLIEIQYTFVP